MRGSVRVLRRAAGAALPLILLATPGLPQAEETRTAKPPLHARHGIAITGTPLAATAGAITFQRGGNAVDAACANLLQFFLDVVEFGMTVQQATEAASITSYQMRSWFDTREAEPGRLTPNQSVPPWVRDELARMGYRIDVARLTPGPINAILFDRERGSLRGGSSNYGEDYGIAW